MNWEPSALGETRGVADPHVSQTFVCDTWAMTPSCQRVRVSYPMSDSMSCIRRAKENASEIRSEKPGRQRSTLFSLPQREAELLRHDTLSDEDSLLARLFHQSKFQRHFGSGNRLRRSVGG